MTSEVQDDTGKRDENRDVPETRLRLAANRRISSRHFSPGGEHSRPQSPSFLGHVVGKRGVTNQAEWLWAREWVERGDDWIIDWIYV